MAAGINTLTAKKAVTIDKIVYVPASKYNTKGTNMKIRAQGVTFKVDKESKVTFSESTTAGKFGLVLCDKDGEVLLSVENGTGSVNVKPGTYMIQSANAEKEAYITDLAIEPVK